MPYHSKKPSHFKHSAPKPASFKHKDSKFLEASQDFGDVKHNRTEAEYVEFARARNKGLTKAQEHAVRKQYRYQKSHEGHEHYIVGQNHNKATTKKEYKGHEIDVELHKDKKSAFAVSGKTNKYDGKPEFYAHGKNEKDAVKNVEKEIDRKKEPVVPTKKELAEGEAYQTPSGEFKNMKGEPFSHADREKEPRKKPVVQREHPLVHKKEHLKSLEPFHKDDTDFHAPMKTAIIVPSTKNGSERVTKKEYAERVRETEKFMSKEYGGFTAVEAHGGYVGDNGELITEPVTEVVAYTDRKTYQEKKPAVSGFLKSKRHEWTQQSMGYEQDKEAELYYFKDKER